MRTTKNPLQKTSIQLHPDLKAIIDREAKLLKISRSAMICNIVEEYYNLPKTSYPTWNPDSNI
jgi:predicted transcriptional regulator